MTAAIPMETFLAHLDRPGATPAPTAAGPGDPPQLPTGPWHPRHADEATYRAWLNSLDTDEFLAEIERGTADVHTTIARHRAGLRKVA